ncbi:MULTISPECIES: hypothetical protein [Pseudoalteromonas]|uniref:Uncharacterized protein n=1 Tax=Pseudoalteromonas maricaloris TaxID=184924 RepID=A0A8I2KLU8_9GAMM|nr:MULTISPECIES: hypothetical protein [Pseudoalteromonas]KID38529.1 hypothetical protein QT15_03400 [Pseudoalteromonas flavipulchra NCIMB 2033 = ATCC BAA-314]MBD0783224.1 hypothetical protein [Pseudoalteromonas flavipulchra]MBE0371882.1 hypothetical protein [Pseudoalteromonas flavipulchra NCIMB 2033 = ATCC BAA-314]NLR22565.1 hypothetical protein [Pseudoalteromonas maricaloris]RZG14788.1 hypothetical protein EXT47_12840 [Pseudoalteromonas sp. CO342X]
MAKFNINNHLFPEQANPFGAVEIGAAPQSREVELTRVVADKSVDGGYRYDGQTWVELSDLKVRSLDYDNPELCFQRMEFRVKADSDQIPPGSILCCSETPYSTFWAANAHFRKGSKNGLPEITDRQTMFEEMERVSVDWWDSGCKYLTAGLPESKFQYYLFSRRKAKNINPMWVFGVLINDSGKSQLPLSKVEAELFSSDRVQGMIANTFAGKEQIIGNKRKIARKLSQHEANALAFISIRQALAGPSKDIEEREFLPVVDEFARIYSDLLHVLSERVEARREEEHIDLQSEDFLSQEAKFIGSSAALVDPAVICRVKDAIATESDLALWEAFEQDSIGAGEKLRDEIHE